MTSLPTVSAGVVGRQPKFRLRSASVYSQSPYHRLVCVSANRIRCCFNGYVVRSTRGTARHSIEALGFGGLLRRLVAGYVMSLFLPSSNVQPPEGMDELPHAGNTGVALFFVLNELGARGIEGERQTGGGPVANPARQGGVRPCA